MKVLVAGDFCQKYRVDDAVKSKRFGDLFDDIKPIVEDADYSIVNFEFPIVLDSNRANPIQKCGPNLKGSIEAVEAIKYAGFDCCTLANNHILDQGERCCLDTKIELEKAGIDTVGIGLDLESAKKILYKQINGETLAIINCCEHEFSVATNKNAGANPLNPISQYYQIQEAKKNADFILIIIHGGHEHFQLPSPRMKSTYRYFIDCGADAVVNHHQHCFSGYEIYKGKLIFYGLGNFLFDHPINRHSIWNDGYMVTLDFECPNTFELHPYSQCNEKPVVSICTREEKDSFDKKLYELNNIICDDSLLRDNVNAYYANCMKSELRLLELYPGKVLKKLNAIGLLPNLMTEKSAISLLNHIECESHRDKMYYALKGYITK